MFGLLQQLGRLRQEIEALINVSLAILGVIHILYQSKGKNIFLVCLRFLLDTHVGFLLFAVSCLA